MNDKDFKLLRGFAHRLTDNGTTNKQTDICELVVLTVGGTNRQIFAIPELLS